MSDELDYLKNLETHTQNKTFVGFVDVLGYGSILSGSGIKSEGQRLKYLLDVWENLTVFLERVAQEFPNVTAIQFSDCMYFSCDDHLELLTCLADYYLQTYLYYQDHPDSWLPWLRAGIGHDWVVEFKDSTISGLVGDYKVAFRNPAGPAIAEAFNLSEKSHFKGMRILVPEQVKTQFWMDAKYATGKKNTVQAYLKVLSRAAWPESGTATSERGEQYEVFDLQIGRAHV